MLDARRRDMDAAGRASVADRLSRLLDGSVEILFACLHGSFERGEPYRDVDVAVWLDPSRVSESEWTRYELDLSVTLELDVGVPVDVRVLNGASLAFRYRAISGRPLVVRDRDFFDDVRARTWDEYFDFLPFARAYLREVLGA